jgi:hypothetical protein
MSRYRAAVFFASFAVAAFGQSDRGSITGTVLDPVGAPIPNLTVQAKNTQTGATLRGNSSAAGKFTIADAPAGTYDITANAPGARAFERKNVAVEPGKTLRLDIRFEDGTQLSTLGEDRLAIEAGARRHNPPSGPTPTTFDGKPDLSGLWWSPQVTDPGKPEFLAAAEAVARARLEKNNRESPQAHCLPSAVIRLGPLFEIVQSRDLMVIISDDDSPGFHQIYLDGRPHPKDLNPAWYGDNIGRWEGDTLVIDRVGFDERVWLDQPSHPHSEKLHVVERYRRPDLGHLQAEITVEDPGVLARPYTFKRVAELAQGEVLHEFICPENNRDIEHLVGK